MLFTSPSTAPKHPTTYTHNTFEHEQLLARSSYHNAVHIRVPEDNDLKNKVTAAMKTLQVVEHVEEMPDSLRVFPKDRQPIIENVAQLARENSWPLTELHVERGRLDEVFRNVTLGNDGGLS